MSTSETNKSPPGKSYSIRINKILQNKLDSHIRLLKRLQSRKCSKQDWIVQAIAEKLEEDKDLPIEELDRLAHIYFKIDPVLEKSLENQVDLIRKINSSYSKKQWILDAIQRKLDKEKPKLQKVVEDLMHNTSEMQNEAVSASKSGDIS